MRVSSDTVYRARGSGKTAFVRGYNSSSSDDLTTKLQALAHFFPGIDVWVSLTPGTYFVANGDADKIENSQVLTMYKAGARVDSAAPAGARAVEVAAFVRNSAKQRNFAALKATEVQVLFVDEPAVVYSTWRTRPGRYVLSNRAYETDGTAVLARGRAPPGHHHVLRLHPTEESDSPTAPTISTCRRTP